MTAPIFPHKCDNPWCDCNYNYGCSYYYYYCCCEHDHGDESKYNCKDLDIGPTFSGSSRCSPSLRGKPTDSVVF